MAELGPTEYIISLSSLAEHDENELANIIGNNEDTINWAKVYEHYKSETSALGLYLMGRMYHHGKGVEQDHTKAKHYYEMAIEKGNSGSGMAMYNLGCMYDCG